MSKSAATYHIITRIKFLFSTMIKIKWSNISTNKFNIDTQNYFGDAWNTFDFIIVLGSIIDIVVSQVNELKNQVRRTSCTLLHTFHILDKHSHYNNLLSAFGTTKYYDDNKTLNISY